jgi:hypothetical protein
MPCDLYCNQFIYCLYKCACINTCFIRRNHRGHDRRIVVYNYMCNHYQLWVRIPLIARCTRYNKVCQLLAASQWFFPGTPVSFSNKSDRHDITEILLKMVLNTVTLTLFNVYHERVKSPGTLWSLANINHHSVIFLLRSGWLLFNAKWAILSTISLEEQVTFDGIMMSVCTRTI